ncbi:MAG: hypothetical protein LC799_17560, partial [Actinobacteria bacterium]|nr:hypothetical protein [Actinomycetota bacterium]
MNIDHMTDDDAEAEAFYLGSRPALLPFRFAGRLSDGARRSIGEDAAGGEYGLLAQGLAGAISREGFPITAEERDLLIAGLRWLNRYEEDEEEKADLRWLKTYPVASQVEVDAWVLERWSFEPTGPAGGRREEALVSALRNLDGAAALLAAWRLGPVEERVRAYCMV